MSKGKEYIYFMCCAVFRLRQETGCWMLLVTGSNSSREDTITLYNAVALPKSSLISTALIKVLYSTYLTGHRSECKLQFPHLHKLELHSKLTSGHFCEASISEHAKKLKCSLYIFYNIELKTLKFLGKYS